MRRAKFAPSTSVAVLQYPLKEVVVIHKDPEILNDVMSLEKYVMEELNVRSVTTSSDKKKYGVKLTALPDFPALGGTGS